MVFEVLFYLNFLLNFFELIALTGLHFPRTNAPVHNMHAHIEEL